MNNGKAANRTARLWIIAGLCGLLVAAFLVEEVKAHDSEVHDYATWGGFHKWLDMLVQVTPACKYHNGHRETCQVLGFGFNEKNQHLFNACVYRLDKSESDFRAYWKSRPELERELDWIYKGFYEKDVGHDQASAIIRGWLYYRCAILDHWKGFAAMKKELEKW